MQLLTHIMQIAVAGQVLTTNGVLRSVVNSFNFSNQFGPDVFDKPAAAAAFLNNQWLPIAGLLAGGVNGWQGVSMSVWFPTVPGDVPQIQLVPPNATGPTSRLPLHQAVYCNLIGHIRGRIYQGCKHFGPVAAAQVVGEELTPAANAAWNTACAPLATQVSWVGGPGVGHWLPVVWSRLYSGIPATPLNQVGGQVNAVLCQQTLSTWRHRREARVH